VKGGVRGAADLMESKKKAKSAGLVRERQESRQIRGPSQQEFMNFGLR